MKIRKSKSLNAERNGGPAEQAGVISTNLFLGEKIKFCSDLSVLPKKCILSINQGKSVFEFVFHHMKANEAKQVVILKSQIDS